MTISEIIAITANLSVLAIAGVLYAAYIKNLRSVVELKESQLRLADQNLKYWKDKALSLERESPEYIEKRLSERIRVREEEIVRLGKDTENHADEISNKNKEIESLRVSLSKANEFRHSITVWDSETKDFIDITESDLDHEHIGSVCVDGATLMVCDPTYLLVHPDFERDEFEQQQYKYRVNETDEYFCTSYSDANYDMELLGLDMDSTVMELEQSGILSKYDYAGDMPAIPETYIKGNMRDDNYRKVRHLTFLNGRVGAGISISLTGDGVYPVYVEKYKGDIQRIIIEV